MTERPSALPVALTPTAGSECCATRTPDTAKHGSAAAAAGFGLGQDDKERK